MATKILLLQIAGLGYNFLKQNLEDLEIDHLKLIPIQGVFPGLTCSVQATIRTASLPSQHGIVGNGFFFKEEWRPLFWEQSSRLIQGKRIWDGLRSQAGRVAQMFIQQSLGTDSDIILSPAPIHKHHGGILLDCFSEPSALHDQIKKAIGTPFPLAHYWGPLASKKSSQWIIQSIIYVMKKEKPDLLYSYIPHLDYALQRFGPDSDNSRNAFRELKPMLEEVIWAAHQEEYKVILFGDYPITAVNDVVFPNRILLKAGFFKTRMVKGMHYPDFYTSAAFCIADHQIAHLHIFTPNMPGELKALMEEVTGIEMALDSEAQRKLGIHHARSGELVLVAKPGFWFDYRWWDDKKEAPEYATHIDIHNKPGYDPGELFWGWPPPSVSQNPFRIKGSHGRIDINEPVVYTSDIDLPGEPNSLLDLAKSLKEALDR